VPPTFGGGDGAGLRCAAMPHNGGGAVLRHKSDRRSDLWPAPLPDAVGIGLHSHTRLNIPIDTQWRLQYN